MGELEGADAAAADALEHGVNLDIKIKMAEQEGADTVWLVNTKKQNHKKLKNN